MDHANDNCLVPLVVQRSRLVKRLRAMRKSSNCPSAKARLDSVIKRLVETEAKDHSGLRQRQPECLSAI
jgi:hypothetical protein